MEDLFRNSVGPALTILTIVITGIAKWLYDLRSTAMRIEQKQDRQAILIEQHTNDIVILRERSAALEGAVFKRPPIIEDG